MFFSAASRLHRCADGFTVSRLDGDISAEPGAWKDKTSTVCNIGSPIGVDLLEISDILVREGTVCGIDYHGRI